MAVTTFDELAESRPRIRRDVLYTRTPDGVLFHNSLGGFHVNGRTAYRLATLIVPYLTGAYRVADLGAALRPEQQAMVADLVTNLYERGFARDESGETPDGTGLDQAVLDRFAPQIAYVDHYAGAAQSRFRAFREARVAVLGDDLVARWCVLSLVRNGAASIATVPRLDRPDNHLDEVRAEAETLTGQDCPVRLEVLPDTGGDYTWADLSGYDVVVTTGSTAPRQNLRLLGDGVPDGCRLLTAWAFGRYAVIGPHLVSGGSGCWSCAALRLGGNGDPEAAARLWQEVALPGSGHEVTMGGPHAAMIGNQLGYEIFRAMTGALPVESTGRVLVQDLESLDVASEPLLPHPGCRRCGAGDGPSTAITTSLSSGPAPSLDVPGQAERLLDELTSRSVLVGSHAGVFAAFTDEPLTQTPLKVSTLRFTPAAGGRREVAAFDLHSLAGARLSVLRAAAVVHVDHGSPRFTGAPGTERHVPVEALTTAAGLSGATGPLVTATSLLTKDEVAVPAAAVWPFSDLNNGRSVVATPAGAGAGSDPAEAAGRGLLSALAYTRIVDAVRGRASVSVLSLADATEPEIVFLRRSAVNAAVSLTVVELRGGRFDAAPVVIAYTGDGGSGAPLWAHGCELTRSEAVTAALRDLLGRVQLSRETGRGADIGDLLVADFDPRVLTVGGSAATAADDVTFEGVLDGIRSSGGDVLLVPTTPVDLAAGGLHTARVLLTGGAPDAR